MPKPTAARQIKRGRPVGSGLPASQRRDKLAKVCLTGAELRQLQVKAKSAGQSLSQWLYARAMS